MEIPLDKVGRLFRAEQFRGTEDSSRKRKLPRAEFKYVVVRNLNIRRRPIGTIPLSSLADLACAGIQITGDIKPRPSASADKKPAASFQDYP